MFPCTNPKNCYCVDAHTTCTHTHAHTHLNDTRFHLFFQRSAKDGLLCMLLASSECATLWKLAKHDMTHTHTSRPLICSTYTSRPSCVWTPKRGSHSSCIHQTKIYPDTHKTRRGTLMPRIPLIKERLRAIQAGQSTFCQGRLSPLFLFFFFPSCFLFLLLGLSMVLSAMPCAVYQESSSSFFFSPSVCYAVCC
jgi:hypothetical protein